MRERASFAFRIVALYRGGSDAHGHEVSVLLADRNRNVGNTLEGDQYRPVVLFVALEKNAAILAVWCAVLDADVMETGLVKQTKQRHRSNENRQGTHSAHSSVSFLTVTERRHRLGRNLKSIPTLFRTFQFQHDHVRANRQLVAPIFRVHLD